MFAALVYSEIQRLSCLFAEKLAVGLWSTGNTASHTAPLSYGVLFLILSTNSYTDTYNYFPMHICSCAIWVLV